MRNALIFAGMWWWACGGTEGIEPCTVTDSGPNQYTLSCPDGTSVIIYNGNDGLDNRIVATIACTGFVPDMNIYAEYKVCLFASGDIWSSGTLYGTDFGLSSSSFYAVQQVGSQTAPVFINLDKAGNNNGGYWIMSLDRKTLVQYITYRDQDISNPESSIEWYMESSNCIVNNF